MLKLLTFAVMGFALAQARPNYSDFSHTTHVTKEKLACGSCHKFPTKNWKDVRQRDAAFPDVTEFPEHASCLDCHRRQFFARERPAPKICANCHVKGTPNDNTRFPFPSLGEPFLATANANDFVSEFRVFFPHDKHSDADCEDCHKTYQPQGQSDDEFVTKPPKDLDDAFWLKKGTFKTRPLTHETCFACHNQETEVAPLPANCDTCHKLPAAEKFLTDFDEKLAGTIGIKDWWMLTAWRNRISAGAFRHETHADLECADCHNVTAMNTADEETLKVPVRSCGGAGGCHITAALDGGGILNYELDQKNRSATFACTKCHVEFGKRLVPASHVNAILRSAVALGFRRIFAHAMPAEPAAADYSQFKHDNKDHARLPCLLCHRRENNSPRPTFPGKDAHTPCTGCHAQQFANPASEICAICHTDAQRGKVKMFPSLRSFDARFDHAKHLDAACGTCHRQNRGGVGFSIPTRLNAHVTCFGCHTPDAEANGRQISTCSTCHQPGRLVRTSERAAAYRVGFSHKSHDWSEKLVCASCHRVLASMPRGRQVTAPLPLHHHAPVRAFSCMSCHNGKRTFGGEDFSVCTRCHEGSRWRF